MLAFAIKTAKQAGSILMQHFGNISSIDRKSTDIDLLTIADTESEAYILDRIKTTYPQPRISICIQRVNTELHVTPEFRTKNTAFRKFRLMLPTTS